jgi:hypothetical protein
LPVGVTVAVLYVGLYVFLTTSDGENAINVFEAAGGWAWLFPVIYVSVPLLIGVVFVLRLRYFGRWLTRQLNQGLKVHPLHPDGCGGLSFIGSTIQRLALFAVFIGLWLIWKLVHSANFQWSIIAGVLLGVGMIVYLLLSWLLVFVPTWSIHRQMERTRSEILRERSTQFEDAVGRKNISDEQRTILMQTLRAQYDIIKEVYPVWPFTLPQWLGLRILSILPPVIASVVSVVQALNSST